MTDSDIYRKALARYRAATGENTVFKDNVIIFLEKEIDRYKGIIQRMENNVDQVLERVKTTDSILDSIAAAEQELSNKCDAGIEQLRKMIENKADQVHGDTVQTFTDERISDSGRMTLATHTKYEEVQEILLRNSYFVMSHFDDENIDDETVTIEFWKE